MSRNWIVIGALALTLATSAGAQQLPPGKWWRRPEVVRVLALTVEQQTRLEGIFRTAAADLIDARGNVEKQNIALRSALDQPRLDREMILRVTRSLNEARARLFEREMRMLVDMGGVLTESQWHRLREQLGRRRDAQRPGQRRP